MNRLQLMIISLFAVALSTGIVVGMTLTRNATVPQDNGVPHEGLAKELGLTPAQSDQMRDIWTEMLKKHQDNRHQLQKERDDSIQAILSPEQKEKYGKIVEQYNQAVAESFREREEAWQSAVERTKAILTDDQRTKYEQLLKQGNRGWPFGHGGPGGGTTRPAGGRRGDESGPGMH